MSNELVIIDKLPNHECIIIAIAGILIFFLIAVMRGEYRGYYSELFYRIFVESLSKREFNRQLEVSIPYTISLVIAAFSISASIFASYSLKITQTTSQSWITILMIILGVCFYTILKLLINLAIGYTFGIEKHTAKYNRMIIDITKAVGLLCYPFFIFIPFIPKIGGNILSVILFSIIGLFLAFEFISYFRYLLKNKFFNHYSILYFCILEILPTIALIKLLLSAN